MKFYFQILWITFITQGIVLSSLAQNDTPLTQNSFKNTFGNIHKTDFSVDFMLGGLSFKEAQDESQLVLTTITPRIDVGVTETFGVRSEANVNITSGRSQTRFQNPNFNFINITEAVAYYEPTGLFNLEAGSVNQSHLGNRMLIADRAFPGLKLSGGVSKKSFRIAPKLQYTIPTSTSFETDRTEAEALPSFVTYGIEASWKPRNWLDLSANLNQFDFSELPSVVAFQSSRLGNSVIGTDPSEALFRYDFKGLSQSYSLNMQYLPALSQTLNFAILENSSAPTDRRRSQWVGTQLNIDLESYSLRPTVATFFAESDSTPSIYSAFEYGRNNREGMFYGLEVEFKKFGMVAKAHFMDSVLIESRPLQADMQIFDLALEFNNVGL